MLGKCSGFLSGEKGMGDFIPQGKRDMPSQQTTKGASSFCKDWLGKDIECRQLSSWQTVKVVIALFFLEGIVHPALHHSKPDILSYVAFWKNFSLFWTYNGTHSVVLGPNDFHCMNKNSRMNGTHDFGFAIAFTLWVSATMRNILSVAYFSFLSQLTG